MTSKTKNGILKPQGRKGSISKPVFEWADKYVCYPPEVKCIEINLESTEDVN